MVSVLTQGRHEMNNTEYDLARALADKLALGLTSLCDAQKTKKGSLVRQLRDAARDLQALLLPRPTMQEILERVPGDTINERAIAIGISRPHYYNLMHGTARRSAAVAKNLANATGIPESVIKEIWLVLILLPSSSLTYWLG